jgi:hypothetical protein
LYSREASNRFDISDSISELFQIRFDIDNTAGQIENAKPTIIQITIKKISDFDIGSFSGYFLFNSMSFNIVIKC